MNALNVFPLYNIRYQPHWYGVKINVDAYKVTCNRLLYRNGA